MAHFMGREQRGKAMVISIDKATAVRMYDKVKKYWKAYLADLTAKLPLADYLNRPALEARIKYMQETDMAVVVSQQQNEVEEFKKKGLDIVAAPQTDGHGGLGNQVQGPGRSVPIGFRVCHVDDRVRRPKRFHDLPR